VTTADLPTAQDIDRELAKRKLRHFVRLAWHVLEPDKAVDGKLVTTHVGGWHLDAICDHLEAVTFGQIRNLLINMPPRHMKSLAAAVFWPVWVWLHQPESRWLFSSYALSLSIRDSLKCRRLIESPWFQSRWGDRFTLTSDQNAKMRFDNDHTGYRIATSVGGYGTGEGGDYIVVDDPHNVTEKESDLIRETTLVWWDETMSTRMNDPRTGRKVIVMQRVHEKDLSGHVLAQGGYEHLCLPAEYEPGRRCVTVLGWEDPRKTEGELLWPHRIGPTEIADFKLRLGPTGYAGQFQQIPTPAGGGRFKSVWFRYFTTHGDVYRLETPNGPRAVKASECDRFAVMDPAGTDKEQDNKACYTVIQVWAVTPDGDMLLLHQYREQAQTPDVADAGVKVCRDWDLPWIGVEKNGLGLGVLQTIKRRGIAVKPILARGTKEARTETAEIRTAAGSVYFAKEAPWRFELERELLLFPNGEFCDQADTFAHSAMHVQRTRGAVAGEGDTMTSPVAGDIAEREERLAAVTDGDKAFLSGEDWDG
jgi:predicted phage terminase large subunit-like protein